jgi:multidrug efflux pump subunit AcrB
VVESYEERIIPLIGNGEIVSVSSSIGLSSGSSGNTAKSNIAQITVNLVEASEGRTRSVTDIMTDIRTLTAGIPGPEEVRFEKATNGPPTDPPVSFRLFGDNYENLAAVSAAIQEKLREYPELLNITDNLERSTPELRIVLRPERASAYGIDPVSLGSFIRDSFEGRTATTYFRDNEEIDVIVRYAETDSPSVALLDGMMIPAAGGRLVPFSSVADIVQGSAIAEVKRVDGKREITITSGAYTKDPVRRINREVKDYFDSTLRPLYPDVTLSVGGEFAELSNLLVQILRIFLIGIFLIYLILGAQFRSYTQPLLILLTIPFSLAGVILYLFVSGTPFSTTVLYAGVALAGISVNDSIVLISFINELRGKGRSVRDAIVEAGTTRLRPILLTSLTTIAGLLPTAAGIGGKSVVWGPMASTIIFGLVFSTLTALFLIPGIYGLIYDRKGSARAAGTGLATEASRSAHTGSSLEALS